MNPMPHTIREKLARLPRATLADLFAADHGRAERLSARFALPDGGILFDHAKTHLDEAHLAAFLDLAAERDFSGRRAALFAGEVVNPSENRAAGHVAQRGVGASDDAPDEAAEEARFLHARMAALVSAIHQGALGEVRHLIHIGIGGSALGPALAIDALARDAVLINVHVVSNIDGCALERAFGACDPATTLIAVASKTFTTIETMINAASALAWLAEGGVPDPYGRVVALTANPDGAVEWGVDETRVLPFPETVGGRFSLWSSIGFPVALALGWPDFAELLEGAAAMDRHFRDTDGIDNLPLRAAFADRLYAGLRGCQTRAVFAYDDRLALLPAWLQQMEMESNGKSVTLDGERVSEPTAPVTWGGVGTDAQHAVFQLLHQGTHLVPTEFVAVIQPGDELDPAHHRNLLANCFAQGAALMAGRDSADLARAYPGDRPSSTILLDDLTPGALGALLAFYEHRTFANAVLMGINPFDQFGVELGKDIARTMDSDGAVFDASTRALMNAAGMR